MKNSEQIIMYSDFAQIHWLYQPKIDSTREQPKSNLLFMNLYYLAPDNSNLEQIGCHMIHSYLGDHTHKIG